MLHLGRIVPKRPPEKLDARAYRKATKKLRAECQVCWLCGGGIDTEQKPSTVEVCSSNKCGKPGQHTTYACQWTADHVIPTSKGGAWLGELRAAHRSCNSIRGNRSEAEVRPLPTSRDW